MNSSADVSNILIIGNWAAGKTQFVTRLRDLVDKEKGIRVVYLESDRVHFEEAVIRDTENGIRLADGSIVGAHSVLVKKASIPGYSVFRALDGALFNEEHKNMLSSLKETKKGDVRIMEYATGPNRSLQQGEELDQSGHFIVETLFGSGAINNTLVIELSSPYNLRFERNKKRWDAVDEKAFELYGQPGGKISLWDEWRMGDHFVRVRNSGTNIDNLVGTIFYRYIHLRLMREEGTMNVEGQLPSVTRRDRR